MIEAPSQQRSSPTTERTAEEVARRALLEVEVARDHERRAVSECAVQICRAVDAETALTEARAEIERLTELANKRWRETKAMQAALEPFAGELYFVTIDTATDGRSFRHADEKAHVAIYAMVGDLRRARAALSQKDGGKE